MTPVKFYKTAGFGAPQYHTEEFGLEEGQYWSLCEGFSDECRACLERDLADCHYPDYEIRNIVNDIADLVFGYEENPMAVFYLEGRGYSDLDTLPPYEVGRLLYSGPMGTKALEEYRDYLHSTLEYEANRPEPDRDLVALYRRHIKDLSREAPPYEEEEEF